MQKQQLRELHSTSNISIISTAKPKSQSRSLRETYPVIPGISLIIVVLLLALFDFGACQVQHIDETNAPSSENRVSGRRWRRQVSFAVVSGQKVPFDAFIVIVAPTTQPLTSAQSAQVADAVKSALLDEFNNEYNVYGSVKFEDVYLSGDPASQWIEGSGRLRGRRELQLNGPRTVFYFSGGEASFTGPSALTPSTDTVNQLVLSALSGRLTGQLNLLNFSFANVVTGKTTDQPTSAPSLQPVLPPSNKPTAGPTSDPTLNPTSSPTLAPILVPTEQPTLLPTSSPSMRQTEQPSSAPTVLPILGPTNQPSTTEPAPAPLSATVSPVWAPSSLPSASLSPISSTLVKLSTTAPSQSIVDTQRPTMATMKANFNTIALEPTPNVDTSSTAPSPSVEKSGQQTNDDPPLVAIEAAAQEPVRLSNNDKSTTLPIAVGCLTAFTLVSAVSAAFFSRRRKNTKQWNIEYYADEHDTPMTMDDNMAKFDMQPTCNIAAVNSGELSDLENEKSLANSAAKNSATSANTDKQPKQHASSVTVISSDYSVSTAHTDYDDGSDWSPRTNPSFSSFSSKYSKHSMGREESFEVVRHMAHALRKDMLYLASDGVGSLVNTTSCDPGREYDKHGDSALAPTDFTASSIKDGSTANTKRSSFSLTKNSTRSRIKQEMTRRSRASRSPVHNSARRRGNSASSAGSSNGEFEEDSAWNFDDNEDDRSCASIDTPFVYDTMKVVAEDHTFS